MRRPDLRKAADAVPKKKKRRGLPPPRKGKRPPRDLSAAHEDVLLDVREGEHGMRLDVFLAERLAWRSRTKVQDMIRDGAVTVSGAPARKPSQRVFRGDRALIRVAAPPPESVRHAEIAAALDVVYEDAHILALDKAPGVVCHPVGKIRFNTLVNALHARYRRPDDPALDVVPRLCHRLDKDTSGLIVVALAPGVRRRMQWIFEARKVVKEYLAVVEGVWERDYEIVDLPIGPAIGSPIRMQRGVNREEGLPSRTVLCVEERFAAHTLVRASPITGRQHQIRVHCAAVGHPVLGDRLYGPEKLAWRGFPPGASPPILDRHALHAARIQLPHPITGIELDLRAPLPADMRRLLEHLRERKSVAPWPDPQLGQSDPGIEGIDPLIDSVASS